MSSFETAKALVAPLWEDKASNASAGKLAKQVYSLPVQCGELKAREIDRGHGKGDGRKMLGMAPAVTVERPGTSVSYS